MTTGTKISNVEGEKAVFVVCEVCDMNTTPNLKADLARRGFDGCAIIRRERGKRQYLAYYTERAGDVSALLVF
jgi:hypothetical protein